MHWICTQNHVFEQFWGWQIFFKWASRQNRTRGCDNFGVKSCAILERKKSWNDAARACRVAKISREMSRGGGPKKPPPPPGGIRVKVTRWLQIWSHYKTIPLRIQLYVAPETEHIQQRASKNLIFRIRVLNRAKAALSPFFIWACRIKFWVGKIMIKWKCTCQKGKQEKALGWKMLKSNWQSG